MNAGVLTVWAITVILILLSTGWRNALFGEITRSRLLVLAGGLVFSLPFALPITEGLSIHLSVLWLIIWSATTIRLPLQTGTMIVLVGGSVVAALGWYGLERLYRVDPVFFILHPAWDGIVLIGLFTGLLTWRFEEQLVIVAFSLLAAETARLLSVNGPGSGLLGSWAWWDSLLAAATVAKLTGTGVRLLWFMRSQWQTGKFQDEGGGHP
ncbi:hypothetical protein [Paenibacillus sp. 1P07SE]|uniref:YphA family membrane protein n=1 Tax=Paenibacillus sp. 1P07SE TaxID=3132209 RepID=UPI0039A69AAD